MIGCGSEGSASAGATVRDSAGIRIVENAEPAWPEEGGWRLSADPILSIGTLEGDPRYQLYRVVDAVRLDDGRIVVGNGGTHEIRAYAPDGRFLWSTGREGDGPGEFRNLGWLERLAPDSLAAYDWGNRRVSIFDERGEFARSFLLELPDQAGFPNPVGIFADGSILLWAGTGFGDIGEVRTGVQSKPVTYYRFDRTGTLIDTVGTFPGPEYYLQTRGQGYTVTSLVFGRAPRVATSGDRFYFGSTESYEIERRRSDGTLEALIRDDRPTLPVTPNDIERYRENRLARAEEEWRPRIRQLLDAMPVPDRMPAYGSLRVDSEGNLWVSDYRRPGDEQPRAQVFDPDGGLLGTVETPPDFTVYEIGPDWVLGRARDELDVESIRIYRLIKG